MQDLAGKILLETVADKKISKNSKDDNKSEKKEAQTEQNDSKITKIETKEVKIETKIEQKEIKKDIKETKSEQIETKTENKDNKISEKAKQKNEQNESQDVKIETKIEQKETKIEQKEIKKDIKETKTEQIETKKEQKEIQPEQIEQKNDKLEIISEKKENIEPKKNETEKISISLNSEKTPKDVDLNMFMENKQSKEQNTAKDFTPKPNNEQINTLETGSQKVDFQRIVSLEKLAMTKSPESSNSSVIDQVKQATAQLSKDKTEITIALKPENLGRVNLNLISEKGVLTAQITAESQQAREMLSKGLDSLKQNLSEQGINVGKIVISVQEPAPANNNSNFEQQSGKSYYNNGFFEANTNANKQNNNNNNQSNNDYTGFESEDITNNNENEHKIELKHNGLVDYKI